MSPRDGKQKVVFIHNGNSRFLSYAVSQAGAAGYAPIVIGDDEVRTQLSSLEIDYTHMSIADLSQEADGFAARYRHLSVNEEGYELFCFKRWFILAELARDIDEVFICADSDILLYPGLDVENLPPRIGGAPMLNTAWFNILRGRDGLASFAEYLNYIYSSVERIELLGRLNLFGGKPHVSDMMALFAFGREYPDLCADAVTNDDEMGFDTNIQTTENFHARHGFKDVFFEDDAPFSHRLDGRQQRWYTLHFQGCAKPLMQKFHRLKPTVGDRYPDLSFIIEDYERRDIFPDVCALYRELS